MAPNRVPYARGDVFEQKVQLAIEDIRNGMTMRRAAKKYSLHHSTLNYRVKQKERNKNVSNVYKNTNFTRQQEEMLVTHALNLVHRGYGVTPWQVCIRMLQYSMIYCISNNMFVCMALC